jgi:hypothetical protein
LYSSALTDRYYLLLPHSCARTTPAKLLLPQLCEEYNLAVVITNQMTADPGGGMTFVADPKKVSSWEGIERGACTTSMSALKHTLRPPCRAHHQR